jgi:hypothetical protein
MEQHSTVVSLVVVSQQQVSERCTPEESDGLIHPYFSICTGTRVLERSMPRMCCAIPVLLYLSTPNASIAVIQTDKDAVCPVR